jgi:hypothetical protein
LHHDLSPELPWRKPQTRKYAMAGTDFRMGRSAQLPATEPWCPFRLSLGRVAALWRPHLVQPNQHKCVAPTFMLHLTRTELRGGRHELGGAAHVNNSCKIKHDAPSALNICRKHQLPGDVGSSIRLGCASCCRGCTLGIALPLLYRFICALFAFPFWKLVAYPPQDR